MINEHYSTKRIGLRPILYITFLLSRTIQNNRPLFVQTSIRNHYYLQNLSLKRCRHEPGLSRTGRTQKFIQPIPSEKIISLIKVNAHDKL